MPFHFHEMQAFVSTRGALDYSSLSVPEATWDDLDPLEFERYRRLVRESRGAGDRALIDLANVDMAKALGAVEANHEVNAVRMLGLLLFGREAALQRFVPTHEVAFQVLSGLQVAVNDFLRWPLLRSMEELMTRFRARNHEQEVPLGILRVGIPDYPERAFREAVANALVHRDYSRLGAVHVIWRDDGIEISSPGGFPEGVTLHNLLVTPPRPRSPLLADAFKRAGIVERTGRGIDTIFFEQVRNGRPAPTYDGSTETDLVLVLPGGEANLAFARLVAEEERAERPLGLDDLLLLNTVWRDRTLDVARAAAIVQQSEAAARRKLQHLVESGLLDARGEGKTRTYHLSPKTYERLGEKAAYVRQRGFEPLQQEQMVLQYVAKHGRITRAETADLCRLAAAQARVLLARLTRAGRLVVRGARRGAYYELPETSTPPATTPRRRGRGRKS